MAEASSWLIDGAMGPAPGRPVRSYTPADREAAYQLWRATAGRNQRQTAAIMGIPQGTIQQWAENEEWTARSDAEDESAATSIDKVARAMVAPLFVKAVLAVGRILDDPSANANAIVKASELAAGWNGLVVPRTSITLNQRVPDAAPLDPALLASLTPSQLAAYARTGILPATTESTRVDSLIASTLDVIDVDPGPDIP